jgi:hypothetical protein
MQVKLKVIYIKNYSDNSIIKDITGVFGKLSISRDKLTIGWDLLKISIVLWPIISLPFILYFGLNGDDSRTAFSKSLIASAITIAAIVAIAFGIRYVINKLKNQKQSKNS